jgi:hypothetical protein
MLVSVCLLGSNLNVHAKPAKLRPPRDKIGILIHLLKVTGLRSKLHKTFMYVRQVISVLLIVYTV